MKSKPFNLLLASMLGAAFAGAVVAQPTYTPTPRPRPAGKAPAKISGAPASPGINNMQSVNPPAGAVVAPGSTINPNTGATINPADAARMRQESDARSRNAEELRTSQIRRQSEEAATRSRDSYGLPQSGSAAGSLGAGTGPNPGAAMSGGSGGLNRGVGTYPGTPPSTLGTGPGTRPTLPGSGG